MPRGKTYFPEAATRVRVIRCFQTLVTTTPGLAGVGEVEQATQVG